VLESLDSYLQDSKNESRMLFKFYTVQMQAFLFLLAILGVGLNPRPRPARQTLYLLSHTPGPRFFKTKPKTYENQLLAFT
jgi:hypothetical protein